MTNILYTLSRMFPFPNSIQKHIRGKSIHEIAEDPQFSPYLPNLAPLTNSKNLTKRSKRKTLGEGSYGRVNLETLSDGIGQVATKYFKRTDNLEENITEMITLKQLSGYPNVAQIVGISSVNSDEKTLAFPALLMAKAQSSLVGTFVNRSWPTLHQTILDILHGYYVLHSLGIVHRDTKPDNMLRTAYGETWITDFGKARYVAPHIPLLDGYTGSQSYSSPEILLKSILNDKNYSNTDFIDFSFDWFAQDCWGVGVTILEILTDVSIFAENGRNAIVQKIFTLRGTPTSEDGELYSLFERYQTYAHLRPIRKASANMIPVLLDSAMHVEIDRKDRDALTTIIHGFLTYDSEKRMTIRQALEYLGEYPTAIPKPLLLANVHLTNMPRHINLLVQTFYYLSSIRYPTNFKISIQSKYIVLDRTFNYFTQYLKTHPDIAKNEIMPVAFTSLLLASCLFNAYGDGFPLSIGQNYGISEQQILKYVPLFDMPFYGITIFDRMLSREPITPPLLIKQYGLLNLLCFNRWLYPSYSDRVDELMSVCAGIVRDPSSSLHKIRQKDYDSQDLFTLELKIMKEIEEEIVTGMMALRKTENVHVPLRAKNNYVRNFVDWTEKHDANGGRKHKQDRKGRKGRKSRKAERVETYNV